MKLIKRLFFFGNDRGQALFETAISLPLFIFAMYGLFWSIRMATLGERLQIGARFGGLATSLDNPYLSYSLYSLYATLDGNAPNTVNACGGPAETEATGGRKSFFTAVAPVPNPTCTPAYFQFKAPEAYTQPVSLQSNWVSLTAAVPVNGLAFFKTNDPTTVASQNFFRSPDVGKIAACSTLGGPFKKSLEPETDTAAPTSPATAFPSAIPTDPPNAQTCVAFGPAPTFPSGQIIPPQYPLPTPTPTPVPTPTPTKAPPTATPGPPTASPAPTAKPTNTPVPTAKPTAAPATATPGPPTATPTAAPPTNTPAPTNSPTHAPTAKPTNTPSPAPTQTPNVNGTPGGGNSNS